MFLQSKFLALRAYFRIGASQLCYDTDMRSGLFWQMTSTLC